MTYLLRVNLDIEESHPEKSLRFIKAVKAIKAFNKNGAKVVIMSHLGRPTGYDKKFSLKKFQKPLEISLKKNIVFLSGKNLESDSFVIKTSKSSTVFLMENLRFNHGEVTDDTSFAKALSNLGDKYINDDFATAHRDNASNVGITKFIKSGAGPTLSNEIKNLNSVLKKPKKPFILIIGGAKMSDKIAVIKNLIYKTDYILLGGGVANTFMKANGQKIGNSIFEPRMISIAKKLIKNKKVLIPSDFVKDGNKITDIGPETARRFTSIIGQAKTVVWGGPMGLFEDKMYSDGTKAVWRAILSNYKASVVVGGGDTVASMKLVGKESKTPKNVFLSTGGGAMLNYLGGDNLPALKALKIQE
jgi:phosphoglycerate kinase